MTPFLDTDIDTPPATDTAPFIVTFADDEPDCGLNLTTLYDTQPVVIVEPPLDEEDTVKVEVWRCAVLFRKY